jgi:hypothetical protein
MRKGQASLCYVQKAANSASGRGAAWISVAFEIVERSTAKRNEQRLALLYGGRSMAGGRRRFRQCCWGIRIIAGIRIIVQAAEPCKECVPGTCICPSARCRLWGGQNASKTLLIGRLCRRPIIHAARACRALSSRSIFSIENRKAASLALRRAIRLEP